MRSRGAGLCSRSPARGRSTRSRATSHAAALRSGAGAARYLDYRRWAFESAALDLALRQAGISLGEAVAPRVAAGRRSSLDGLERRLDRASASRGSASTPGCASSSTPTTKWNDGLIGRSGRRTRSTLSISRGTTVVRSLIICWTRTCTDGSSRGHGGVARGSGADAENEGVLRPMSSG